MQLKGKISGIIFYNAQNGYTVLSLDTGKAEHICVGNFPNLCEGEELTLEGSFSLHGKYGEQFVVTGYTVETPRSRESVIMYLSNGLIKGVGEITAEKIYAHFGESTMDIIKEEPSRLSEVKGISPSKAADISNSYRAIKDMQTQILYLQGLGITVNTALKIYNSYKDATKEIVSNNPYKLIDDIEGIGFITADKIARKMGIDEASPFRIRAAVIYCLKDSAEKQGNTFLSEEDASLQCTNLLELDLKELYAPLWREVLGRLTLDVTVRCFDIGSTPCISLSKFYNMEKAIADKLLRLNAQTADNADYCDILEEFERAEGLKLHSSQKEAVINALKQGVTVITGGPGTGKTTIIKCITHVLGKYGKKIELCAPTGRASKRLSEASGLSAKTIHRMLGVSYASGSLAFTFNQFNTLPADVVIIDEVSMVDVGIMYSLLRALDAGAKLILVGDKDQLPSVGAGNVLADIISSGTVSVNCLTHIYRQEEGSRIVSNAHLINNCKMPLHDSASKDFFIIERANQEDILRECLALIERRLPNWLKDNAKEIQLLAALKGGAAGVNNFNKQLQELLNPPAKDKRQMTLGDTVFRTGDRVMQTVNDYEQAWQKSGGEGVEEGEGVFNGDIGVIIEVSNYSGGIIVRFDDDRVAQYTSLTLSNLTLAYAMTIHKSQGSEFDCVVIPLVAGAPTILNKNLLYTAVTRAKKVVVLVCSKKVLSMVVHNNYIAQRTTLLKKFLQEEKEKYGSLLC